ncbi:hypothetical protein [Terasakiella pusilla]|uniref:hypothetical protein n=1 Tax=Terasakiella pusilla TaxID=64973 RepID=UPI003AA98FBC
MKVVLLFFLAAAITVLGVVMYLGLPSSSEDWENLIEILFKIIPSEISFFSLLGVWLIRKEDQNKTNSEAYLKYAILAIERAYNVISDNETRDSPVKDRLEWLTCGRWLVVSNKFSKKITDENVYEIFEDEQEFWRIKFYNFFKPHELGGFSQSISNFQEDRVGSGNSLDSKSVTTIYKFIEWPEDRADPIDDQELYTEEEVEQLNRLGKVGLYQYLKR